MAAPISLAGPDSGGSATRRAPAATASPSRRQASSRSVASASCTTAAATSAGPCMGGSGCRAGSSAMARYSSGRRLRNTSVPSGRRLSLARPTSRSAKIYSASWREAMASTVPSGATTWLSPAPLRNSTGMPVAALIPSTMSSGTSGPTLLAATTNTLFSAARTGICNEASSVAKELRLLSMTWAPLSARQRGVSLITPSMQAYMPRRPRAVVTTGPSLPAGARKSFSWPI